MKEPGVTVRERGRKWLRRAGWGAGAVLAAVVAVPFVFPGAVVRYWLAHSAYRDVPVRFRSAVLSPLGRLTVYGLEIDEPGTGGGAGGGAGRSLLRADKAQVAFSWLELSANQLESVVLENMELSVHPGKEAPGMVAGTGQGTAPVTGLGAATDWAAGWAALQCDEIMVTGHVKVAGFEPWQGLAQVRDDEPVPVQLVVRATGTSRDVSLILGEADLDARPFVTARFTVKAAGGVTTLNVERLNVGNLSPEATEALWKAWPGLPAALRRSAAGHFERVVVSGSATMGRELTVNATAELRDLTAHTGEAGAGIGVEHLSATAHVEGKITATPLKDLKFSRAHCSWEALRAGDWRLQKGEADFSVEGTELVLSDLQAQCLDAEVAATAAYDLTGGILTRGRLWISDFSARTLRERLPAELRGGIPDAFDGTLSARVFLSDSDADHLALLVELACPDELAFNISAPAAGTDTPGKPGAISPGAMWPGAVLSNAVVSGTVSWNLHGGWRPEISHGRLTADELLVIPAAARGSMEGTSLSRIKADFNLTGDMARLDDFYADLPGNGRLSIEGNYTLDDQSLEDVVLSLNGIDLALANPWLAAGWTMTGQLDAEWRGGLSPRAAALEVSLGLATQMQVKGPDATLSVAGTPPVMALRLATDRRTGATQIQAAEIGGLGAIQADGGFVKWVRKAAAPQPGGAAALVLDRIGDGAYISFDKLGFTGHFGPANAGGTVTCSGLDLGAGGAEGAAGQEPALENLTLKAEAAAALGRGGIPDAATLRVTGGQLLAEKMSLGHNVFTEIAGDFSAEKGRVFITRGTASVAEGTIGGGATLGFDGRLEALQLEFAGLHQQVLLRNLYPEVFTAEGPISGKAALRRAGDGRLTGSMELTANQPGRVKLTREASETLAAQAAKAAVRPGDALLPENSSEIAAEQLADYPYIEGKASLVDGAGGLRLALDYARLPLKEGDPGYGVPVTVGGRRVAGNVEYELRGSLTLHENVAGVLGRLLGFQESLTMGASQRTRP